MSQNKREDMNIVIVGHVDHGKSTLMGRLLADTDSLPEGKLAQVQETCRRNSKPFEYAFLLDALKDEQAQGITIDTASGINAVVITKLFDEEVLIEVIKLNPIPISKAASIMIMNSCNPTIPLTKIESNI